MEEQLQIRPFQLSKQECRVCSKPRWNDGLRCPHCNSYQNPRVGAAQVDYEYPAKNSHRVIR